MRRRDFVGGALAGGAVTACSQPPETPAVAAGADAVLAASVFHFGQLRIPRVKDALSNAGYGVRREVASKAT